jgi:hypothetical protein
MEQIMKIILMSNRLKILKVDLIYQLNLMLLSFGIGLNIFIINISIEVGKEEVLIKLEQLFMELNSFINLGQKHWIDYIFFY